MIHRLWNIPERAICHWENKNSFFEKSVLWQLDSPTRISSIPTLLSGFKFSLSLNKDQRNSWGEWKDGLRGDGHKLKLDGSWVKAGQDLTLQQTPSKPPTLSTAPKVGEEARVSPPLGDRKSVAALLLRLGAAAGALGLWGGVHSELWRPLTTREADLHPHSHKVRSPDVFGKRPRRLLTIGGGVGGTS